MPATIRLKRMGRKKQPYYRIVVADDSGARDAPPVEMLGVYNPRTEPAVVRVDAARALHWLHEGAKPSDTVRSLFRRAGLWEKFHAGETGEGLEEKVIHLGPAPGEERTTQRVSGPPKQPSAKAPSSPAAAVAAAATKMAEAVTAEEAVEEVAEAEVAEAEAEVAEAEAEVEAVEAEVEAVEAEAEVEEAEAEVEEEEEKG
jgi:small subunit ribosomal protein S16